MRLAAGVAISTGDHREFDPPGLDPTFERLQHVVALSQGLMQFQV
jgi:hypothetical protein